VEEKAILENEDATEKQAVERLLKARALRDVRDARLSNARKRIVQHVDLVRYDLCEPLRKNFTNLAFALLTHRRQRMEKLFHELLGNGVDHNLPISTLDLVQRCKPVLNLERFCAGVREARKPFEEELAELRSELPHRWLIELRRVIQEES
jgi:hypothetical protein